MPKRQRLRKSNVVPRALVSALLALAFSLLTFSPAQAAQGIALWGALKYQPGFSHFDYTNPTAPKGGTLKLESNAAFDSMNPFLLKGVAAPGLQGFVYQTLMTQSADEPQSFYGLLASDIHVAPDRSTVTFTLNPAARWSDGNSITSADVVFSFDTLKAKAHPLYKILLKPVSDAVALDAQHVRFTLNDRTHRELPLILAGLPVLPKHGFCGEVDTNTELSPRLHDGVRLPEKDGPRHKAGVTLRGENGCQPFDKTSLTPPIGSGPYTIAHVDAGRAITYKRDKNYWGANLPSQRGLYNFDTIRYDVYRDDVVALEGIKSHQFDFHEEFIARNWATSYNIPAVKSGELVKTLIPHKIPRGMQAFLFNTRLPKFSDVRVREAIGLTLDFEWMNRVLFYNAYTRNSSYFNNTDFEAKGLPDSDELKLLKPFADELPPALFITPYTVPTTDGSGFARDNLVRAQALLNDAGWVMRDGKRVNAKTGEALAIEFLMTQRTFERVIGIMRHNLDKLGIASTFRYVDASQYQQRVDSRQFEMISIWWNQGLFYPGTEQQTYWHSSQADIKGSQNLAGVKNPAVDFLVENILQAKTLDQLIPAGRALDRVLLNEHYAIPHWNINAWRVAYWDQFGRPKITPAYSLSIESWWSAPALQTVEHKQ
ncbi:MAG: extracellular solute-binding protein [Rickettsiales bacterium]